MEYGLKGEEATVRASRIRRRMHRLGLVLGAIVLAPEVIVLVRDWSVLDWSVLFGVALANLAVALSLYAACRALGWWIIFTDTLPEKVRRRPGCFGDHVDHVERRLV